jgi:hypothetical protein
MEIFMAKNESIECCPRFLTLFLKNNRFPNDEETRQKWLDLINQPGAIFTTLNFLHYLQMGTIS